MDLPTPPQAVAALAAFVRDRLADIADLGETMLTGRNDVPVISTMGPLDRSMVATARQVASVIIGAAAPFAPTSYSRARLVRQMHASGLLSADELRRATVVLDLDPEPGRGSGVPR